MWAMFVVLIAVKRWHYIPALWFSIDLGGWLNGKMQAFFGRVRPQFPDMEKLTHPGFPSGHTVSVAAFATAIALVLVRLWPRHWVLVTTCAVVWVGLVALSRVVLGVHWPTDVLAAACLGAVMPLLASLTNSVRSGDPRAT